MSVRVCFIRERGRLFFLQEKSPLGLGWSTPGALLVAETCGFYDLGNCC